ncbi:MAG: pyridoxamine 5'-phosphate oxidase family protein [Pseudomonadota bacterium]
MPRSTDEFWTLLADMTACMVTTRDGDVLRSRPMAPYVDTEKRTIRFLTDRASSKVFEVKAEQDINLSFADQSKMIFASVSATASLLHDEALIDDMWGPYAKVFFGEREDADVVVIDVKPTQAELWDNDKNMVAMALEMGRAYFSEDGPDLGENQKMSMVR